MTKQYHPFSHRAGSALKWGLLAISVLLVVAYWPNERRRIERQILGMAAAISHHGSTFSPDWLDGLSTSIHENCSKATTTVEVQGLVNEALTQAQIIEGVTQVVSNSTHFSVKLEQVTINLSSDSQRAQVNADAVVEFTHEGRADRERRHVSMALRKTEGIYRLVSVEASAPIVNQPEPRP